jgi:hypothetical protein
MGCAHTNKEKNEQTSKVNISTTTKKIAKPLHNFVSTMMLGTPRSNDDDEWSCFAKVVAYRMEMAQFEAIFRYFQKPCISFSKIGLLTSDCLCLNVQNTRYPDMKRCRRKIK